MSAFVALLPVDFIFDHATTNLLAGSSARTGQSTSYTWRGMNQNQANAFALDNESYAEVAGLEVFGPQVGNELEKLKSIRMIIDGKENANITFNERMAPGLSTARPDPMDAAGMRLGHACINLGTPMLMGGPSWDATPKIGAGEKLEIEIKAPLATEGGATVDQVVRVRLWMALVKGEKKLLELLKYHGHLNSSGQVDCSFDVGDLEITEAMPMRSRATGNAIIKNVPGDRAFKGSDWTRLHGGNDADKPFVENYITYCQNNAATTTNEWFQPTQNGNRVTDSWQELSWNLDKLHAMKISHIGFANSPNNADYIKYLRLYRSGRNVENIYEVHAAINPFPMPAGKQTTDLRFYGPGKLARGAFAWNEELRLEFKDNGNAVAAWSALNDGFMCAIYGKKFELLED